MLTAPSIAISSTHRCSLAVAQTSKFNVLNSETVNGSKIQQTISF